MKKKKKGLVKLIFWGLMNFLIKYWVKVYYGIKYKIRKPIPVKRDGLLPVSHKQEDLIKFTYQQLLANGKKPREARRIIEKKMRIKVLKS